MAEVITTGSAGTYLTYTLYDDGLMRIEWTGTGSNSKVMTNWTSPQSVPWHEYRDQIKKVELIDVMTLGGYAFYNCVNLMDVDLGGVYFTSFGTGGNQFSGCVKLTDGHLHNIPETNWGLTSATTITGIFQGCGFRNVDWLSDLLQYMPTNMFYGNIDLESIKFPPNVIAIGSGIVRESVKLTELRYPASLQSLSSVQTGFNPNLAYVELNNRTTLTNPFTNTSPDTLRIIANSGTSTATVLSLVGPAWILPGIAPAVPEIGLREIIIDTNTEIDLSDIVGYSGKKLTLTPAALATIGLTLYDEDGTTELIGTDRVDKTYMFLNDKWINQGRATPESPPQVLAILPSGEDVTREGNISIVFDKAMDNTLKIQLNDMAPLTGSWPSDKEFNIPYRDLEPETEYEIKVSGFKDNFGLLAPFAIGTFRTIGIGPEPEPTDDLDRRIAKLRRITLYANEETYEPEYVKQVMKDSTAVFLNLTNRTKELGERVDDIIIDLCKERINKMGLEGSSTTNEGGLTQTYEPDPLMMKRIARYRLMIGMSE